MRDSLPDRALSEFVTHKIMRNNPKLGKKISGVGSASVNGPVSCCRTEPPANNNYKLWTKDSHVKIIRFDTNRRFWN